MFRVNNDYREFMREMGVEIVCLWGFWVILRKRAEEGEFVLYTDVESRIEHYSKVRRLFKVGAVIEIICFFIELLAAGNGGDAFSWVTCCIVGAVAFTFCYEVNHVNRILAELKERVDGGTECGLKCRRRNIFLVVGLLLNAIGFLIPRTQYFWGLASDLFHVSAIIFLSLVWCLHLRTGRGRKSAPPRGIRKDVGKRRIFGCQSV